MIKRTILRNEGNEFKFPASLFPLANCTLCPIQQNPFTVQCYFDCSRADSKSAVTLFMYEAIYHRVIVALFD